MSERMEELIISDLKRGLTVIEIMKKRRVRMGDVYVAQNVMIGGKVANRY